MEINWTLLLLIAVVALGLLGLIIALQSTSGRKRLADAALRLAESLIAYAIGWLERNQGGINIPSATVAATDQRIADARAALMILRGI